MEVTEGGLEQVQVFREKKGEKSLSLHPQGGKKEQMENQNWERQKDGE